MLTPIGTRKIKQKDTYGTILDGSISKRMSVNIEKIIPGGVSVGEGTRVKVCRLPKRLRSGLARDAQGNVVLTPVLRAFDSLLEAVETGNGARARSATAAFYSARCLEMKQEFEKIAKPRNERSAMLVGICGYRSDIFSGESFQSGSLCDLKPWQIGLGNQVIARLGIRAGDLVIFSRFPSTCVIAMEVIEADMDGNVVALPVGNCIIDGEETSAAKELGGDRDGDCYTVRTVGTEKAVSELRGVFKRFWFGVEPVPVEETTYTWEAHESAPCDEDHIAYEKFLQKSAVGSVTLDWYAAFVALQEAKKRGAGTELGYEDIRVSMMDALESVFDLKHGNGADPMTLHALLLGMTSLGESEGSLKSQGMDISTISRLMEMLGGRSVRDAAMDNLAYAIVHGHTEKNFNPVERFAKRVPGGTSLAEAFRQEMFPFGYGDDTGKDVQ